jgi:hypothetical protein
VKRVLLLFSISAGLWAQNGVGIYDASNVGGVPIQRPLDVSLAGCVLTWNVSAKQFQCMAPPTVASSNGGGGGLSSIANIGNAGVGLYDSMAGSVVNLRNLAPGSNKVTITLDAGNHNVDVDVSVPNVLAAGNLASLGTRNYGDLQNIPGSFTPSAHAATHASNGSDPITPASIGAQSALGFTPENPANKGAPNGYAPLNANALIPAANLPAIAAINGTTVPSNNASDQAIVTTAAAVGSWAALPSCPDTGGNHLNYSVATHGFLCGNTGGSVGSVGFSGVSGGTNASALVISGTLGYATGGLINANQIGGVSLSSLATGLMKITTGTGAPSTATAADVTTTLGFTPLNPVNNLSDVTNAAAARANIGALGASGTGATGTWGISVTGTASALSATPTQCGTGQYSTGVAASGNANCGAIVYSQVSGAPSSLPPNGSAGGDLGGAYPGPTVATVGGSTAAAVHSAEQAANAATNQNTASAIVKRDISGNFSAGTITATLAGNASTASSLASSPTLCPAGSFPLGVSANGAAQGCTAPPGSSGTIAFNNNGVPAASGATADGNGNITATSLTTGNTTGVAGSVNICSAGGAYCQNVTVDGSNGSLQLNGADLSAANLSDGVSGSGPIVKGMQAAIANPTITGTIAGNPTLSNPLGLVSGGTGTNLAATGGAHQYLKQSSVGGAVTVGQPACADISNAAPSCWTDTTNASNITSGTLAVTQLPNPIATAGSGGVTANYLASKDTSNPTKYVLPGAGGCGTGVASATAASGTAFELLSIPGSVLTMVADNSITAGDILIGGSVTPGRVADSGYASRGSIPSTTCIVGVAQASATAGSTVPVLYDGVGNYGTQVTFPQISGTVAAAQLPLPTATTLGGVESLAATSHLWINAISTSGIPTAAQPACADLSNAAPSCSTDTTNASNITSGTLAASRVPILNQNTTGNAATATALATTPAQCSAGQYSTGIAAAGTANCAQVAYTQVSGTPTIPTSLPPSGATGGDLIGSYPNPQVAQVTGGAVAVGSCAASGGPVHGCVGMTMGSAAPTPTTGMGIFYGDSTTNTVKGSYNGGAFSFVPLTGLANSFTAPQTFSAAGAASTPGLTISGAPYTGGSATTNTPQTYLNSGANAPSTFSTAGTIFGVNAPSGFTGNLLDFHVNGGSSVASLTAAGALTVASCTGCGTGGGSMTWPSAAGLAVYSGSSTWSASIPTTPQAGGVGNDLSGGIGDIQTGITVNTVGTAGTEPNLYSFATTGSIQPGTTYRITFEGTGSSTASSVTSYFNVYYGSTGTSADTNIGTMQLTSATSSGTSYAFSGYFKINFRSASTVHTAGALWEAGALGISNVTVKVVNSSQTTVTSSSTNKLSFTYVVTSGSSGQVSATITDINATLVQP